jgi:hypothetical protein
MFLTSLWDTPMIDTIVLTLPQESFTITNPDAFTPSAQWAYSASSFAKAMEDTSKDRQHPITPLSGTKTLLKQQAIGLISPKKEKITREQLTFFQFELY